MVIHLCRIWSYKHADIYKSGFDALISLVRVSTVELRSALQLAEMEREGGFAPHVSPFVEVSLAVSYQVSNITCTIFFCVKYENWTASEGAMFF